MFYGSVLVIIYDGRPAKYGFMIGLIDDLTLSYLASGAAIPVVDDLEKTKRLPRPLMRYVGIRLARVEILRFAALFMNKEPEKVKLDKPH